MDQENSSMSLSEGSNGTFDSTPVDNSSSNSDYSADNIAKALDEPTEGEENNNEEKAEEVNNPQEAPSTSQDNAPATEYPDKFKKQDGSLDTDKLLKSYKELEPLLSERAAWQKERADLLKAQQAQIEAQETEARNAGFQSALDMQQHYEVIHAEANEYAKYLHTTDDPEAVRNMLVQYYNNPSQELLDDIRLEFPPSVIENVAVVKEALKNQFKTEKAQYEQTTRLTNIENVISQSVESNEELFEYQPFKDLFTKTLQKFGDQFTYEDAQLLMGAIGQLKQAWHDEYVKQTGAINQNKEATDKLASISSINSAPAASQPRSIDSLSNSELAREIRKYI